MIRIAVRCPNTRHVFYSDLACTWKIKKYLIKICRSDITVCFCNLLALIRNPECHFCQELRVGLEDVVGVGLHVLLQEEGAHVWRWLQRLGLKKVATNLKKIKPNLIEKHLPLGFKYWTFKLQKHFIVRLFCLVKQLFDVRWPSTNVDPNKRRQNRYQTIYISSFDVNAELRFSEQSWK